MDPKALLAERLEQFDHTRDEDIAPIAYPLILLIRQQDPQAHAEGTMDGTNFVDIALPTVGPRAGVTAGISHFGDDWVLDLEAGDDGDVDAWWEPQTVDDVLLALSELATWMAETKAATTAAA